MLTATAITGSHAARLAPLRQLSIAPSLAQFARTVDLGSVGQPSFLAVLTGANVYPTRRPDGIDVIPIATLGP
jgi:hypothetical protein